MSRVKISVSISKEAQDILASIASRSNMSPSRVVDSLLLSAKNATISLRTSVVVDVSERRRGC